MILIDFDGTIVDLWPRYHAVFEELAKVEFSLEEYKRLKQKYKKDEVLASRLGVELPSGYFSQKASYLEDCHYLSQDTLLVPKEAILHFADENNAFILSKRRRPENLIWELNYLGLSDYSSKVVCVAGAKLEWAQEKVKEKTTIVGDDVGDLQVASLPEVDAAMVLTGLGTKSDFEKTGIAHRIFPSLDDFINGYTQLH